MNFDFPLARAITRREAVGLGAAAAGALAGLNVQGAVAGSGGFSDEMFDVQAVLDGAWDDTAFYRRGDRRGTLQEVTARKTRDALRLLDRGRPVFTYDLGQPMFNGMPAFATVPPRVHEQRLVILGYDPPPGYDGILQSPAPLGPNRISAHEERFAAGFSYQLGTQLDHLNHIGVGPVFYGGRRGPQIAQDWGTSHLGAERAGPIVTRGVLLDVLALKLAEGASHSLAIAPNGALHLAATYRITLDDLQAAMRRARIATIEPGDAVLIRTGWNQLIDDPESYLATEPGIYLREARWLASHRPAIIGSDNWGLEVTGNPISAANVFPVHQELITHHGIRIGEAIVLDRLAHDRMFEFVYIVTPQIARGATAGNTPPCALGQPTREG
jgi:hypothetical protein